MKFLMSVLNSVTESMHYFKSAINYDRRGAYRNSICDFSGQKTKKCESQEEPKKSTRREIVTASDLSAMSRAIADLTRQKFQTCPKYGVFYTTVLRIFARADFVTKMANLQVE